MKTKILLISFCFFIFACAKEKQQFDQYPSSQATIPSGSIIIAGNSNGTTGPGIISVWTSQGELDRVVYDYTKDSSTFHASGLAMIAPTSILAIRDMNATTGEQLDLFDYETPMANPLSLFSNFQSGSSYMRSMALVESLDTDQYYIFAAEAGNNRVVRLSSPIAESPSGLDFARDFNFAANGTCTLTTPYGVAHIPTTGHIAVIHSAATGRVNIFDTSGTCQGSTSMTNTPTDVAYHALSGKLIVTYSGNSSISAHDLADGAQNPASALYTSTTQLASPRAVATDADGYIYVSSSTNDNIVKLYWDGVSSSATYIGTIIATSVFSQNVTSILVVP